MSRPGRPRDMLTQKSLANICLAFGAISGEIGDKKN